MLEILSRSFEALCFAAGGEIDVMTEALLAHMASDSELLRDPPLGARLLDFACGSGAVYIARLLFLYNIICMAPA